VTNDPRAMTLDDACHEAQQIIHAIHGDVAREECRFLWSLSTYGRVFSLAALSHEALALEEITQAGARDASPAMMALLVRHFWETWVTGMYLLLGGAAAFERFAGSQRRSDDAFQKEIDDLQARGISINMDYEPLGGLEEYEKANWSYQEVMKEVGRLGVELNVFATSAEEMYTMIYRALSNFNGAHPTIRLLDKYIDTKSTTFSNVRRRPELPMFRTDAVLLAVVLACVHAGTFLDQIDAAGVDKYATVIARVLPAS
jgi:hypothetical protein